MRKVKTFNINGSFGTCVIDETGKVLEHIGDPGADEPGAADAGYTDIDRFDVEEYIEYNGCLDDTDILLIGYWTKDGTYEPPEYEHRELLYQERPDMMPKPKPRPTQNV